MEAQTIKLMKKHTPGKIFNFLMFPMGKFPQLRTSPKFLHLVIWFGRGGILVKFQLVEGFSPCPHQRKPCNLTNQFSNYITRFMHLFVETLPSLIFYRNYLIISLNHSHFFLIPTYTTFSLLFHSLCLPYTIGVLHFTPSYHETDQASINSLLLLLLKPIFGFHKIQIWFFTLELKNKNEKYLKIYIFLLTEKKTCKILK